MSVARFEIHLDEPHATYAIGEHVTGRVTLELLKEKTVRAIEIHFLGDAKVEFTKSRGGHTQYCSGEEVYFTKSYYVVGGSISGREITLPPGIYNYPFDMILPTNIPSSFEEKYGRIRYIVKAAIRLPWRFDYTCKAFFTVLNQLDLNRRPEFLNPVRTTEEWNFCSGCCGPAISVTISLPFAGYVPGQRCKAVFEIDNPTKYDIALQASLLQVITFTSVCGSRKVLRKIVSEKELGEITPRRSTTSSASLQIPALPNSSLDKCRYIDISYYFEITGSGTLTDYRASVPIAIGSIPFVTQFADSISQQSVPLIDTNSAYMHSVEEDEQETSSTASAATTPYQEIPPPSYEESVSGETNARVHEDNKYVQGEMGSPPRYPGNSFWEDNS